jgi:hypothetical protein
VDNFVKNLRHNPGKWLSRAVFLEMMKNWAVKNALKTIAFRRGVRRGPSDVMLAPLAGFCGHIRMAKADWACVGCFQIGGNTP